MALAREAAVLQIKLVVDGFRDALLIPISLVAAIIGIFRGGEDADREFREVLKLGRRTERWINLFGYHRPYSKSHPAGSMDRLINTAATPNKSNKPAVVNIWRVSNLSPKKLFQPVASTSIVPVVAE